MFGSLILLVSLKLVINDLQITEMPKKDTIEFGGKKVELSAKVNSVPRYEREEVGEKKYYLNSFPGVLNWIIFHCGGIALGITFSFFIVLLIRDLMEKFKIKFDPKSYKLGIGPPAIIVFGMILLGTLMSTKDALGLVAGSEIMDDFGIIFQHPHFVTSSFIMIYMLVGFFALVGMAIINISVSKTVSDQVVKKTEIYETFKRLKEDLNVFAFFSGLLLGIAIIGTGLQRTMISEHFENSAEIIQVIYPASFVYAYGIQYTVVLVIFYIPSLVYLNYSKGAIFSHEQLELGGKGKSSWLSISKNTVEDLKIVFSIFIPLLSSMLEVFI
ncbi:MAG: hypothetical protein Mars2KO_05140 [Maribacter sp.]